MTVGDWDAASYERVSDPQLEWGRAVLERLGLRGDETVLDAGCGTGRVTRLLAESLPRGRVVAVDSSAAMVAEAGARLADLGERVEVRRADLLELKLERCVDAAVSTATFHWILDHDRLFARLHDAVAPGGRLVAQCGGAGNVARTLEAAAAVAGEPPFSESLVGMTHQWLFAGPWETVARLRRAGFAEAHAWLEEAPVRLAPDGAEEYLETVVLRCHAERLPPPLRRPFAREVAGRCREGDERVLVDYVRLNIAARRAGEAGR